MKNSEIYEIKDKLKVIETLLYQRRFLLGGQLTKFKEIAAAEEELNKEFESLREVADGEREEN